MLFRLSILPKVASLMLSFRAGFLHFIASTRGYNSAIRWSSTGSSTAFCAFFHTNSLYAADRTTRLMSILSRNLSVVALRGGGGSHSLMWWGEGLGGGVCCWHRRDIRWVSRQAPG